MVSYDHVQFPETVAADVFLPTNGMAVRTTSNSAGATSFHQSAHSIPPAYADPVNAESRKLLWASASFEISSSRIDNENAIQLLYSDGIETASVFAQSGAAAVSTIPSDWTKVPIGGETAYQNLDGHLDALTWNRNGYRYTAVSHLTPASLKSFVQSELK